MDGSNITLADIERARDRAAQLVILDEAYTPVFLRLEAECEQLKAMEGASVVERARARIRAQAVT